MSKIDYILLGFFIGFLVGWVCGEIHVWNKIGRR
jgi:hypothetical protein